MSLTQRECKSVRPIRNLQMCFKHPLIFIQEIFIFWDSFPNCFLRDPLLDVNPETAGITEKITERRSTGSRREMLCDLSSSLKTTLEIPYFYGRIIIQYWKSFLWSPHAILSHKTHNWLSFKKMSICFWFDKLISTRQDESKTEFLHFINQPIPTLSLKAQPKRLCSPKWLATPSAVIGATNDARKRALTLQGSPFSMAWMDTSCLAMPLLRSFRWRHMSHPDSSCQPPAERPGHSAHDYYRKKWSSAANIELA